jgi:hypothetical protein
MDEGSSSGGRGPTSIKPPTIKPPTARDEMQGSQTVDYAPGAMSPVSAPSAAMPLTYLPQPPAAYAAPPRRGRNVLLWVVIGAVLLGFLIIVLGVVLYLWLR